MKWLISILRWITPQQSEHVNSLPNNKIIDMPAPSIHKSEENLNRFLRRLLAQIRADKSPFLLAYKHKIDPISQPSPLCPLCSTQPHNTTHLFQCTKIHTTLTPLDLWNRPCEAAELLEAWGRALDYLFPDTGDGEVSSTTDFLGEVSNNNNNRLWLWSSIIIFSTLKRESNQGYLPR